MVSCILNAWEQVLVIELKEQMDGSDGVAELLRLVIFLLF